MFRHRVPGLHRIILNRHQAHITGLRPAEHRLIQGLLYRGVLLLQVLTGAQVRLILLPGAAHRVAVVITGVQEAGVQEVLRVRAVIQVLAEVQVQAAIRDQAVLVLHDRAVQVQEAPQAVRVLHVRADSNTLFNNK